MDKTEKILSIIDKLLTLVENKELDEKLDRWVEYMVSEDEDEEEIEEGREEVTEHVKDNSPKSLKEENEHLSNLLDSMCELY
jgi:cell shape-determining protein MreC